MTRINCIDPKYLTDEHLQAELRELPRIFSLVEQKGIRPDLIPDSYRMGEGHVNFFRGKRDWLTVRFIDLYLEHVRRFKKVPGQKVYTGSQHAMGRYIRGAERSYDWWRPSREDKVINLKRLIDRTRNAKRPLRYYESIFNVGYLLNVYCAYIEEKEDIL